MKFVIKVYCHDQLVEQVVVEAEHRKQALEKFLELDCAQCDPDDTNSWPRRGDTLCVDISPMKPDK